MTSYLCGMKRNNALQGSGLELSCQMIVLKQEEALLKKQIEELGKFVDQGVAKDYQKQLKTCRQKQSALAALIGRLSPNR